MIVVIVATIFALAALVTGIVAIGSGTRWQFTPKDIMRGRKNAVLYVWVTLSTMFSLAHFASCFQYAMIPLWGFGAAIQSWFALHALVGLILSLAHGYIHLIMEREGATEAFLWGPHRNV